MSTTVIEVPEVHCDHCVASIEGALVPIDGVRAASVSLSDTNVTVEHDDTIARRDLVAAIEGQGYEVPPSP